MNAILQMKEHNINYINKKRHFTQIHYKNMLRLEVFQSLLLN